MFILKNHQNATFFKMDIVQGLYNIIFIHLRSYLKHLPWNCFNKQYIILYIFNIPQQKPLLFFKKLTYISQNS